MTTPENSQRLPAFHLNEERLVDALQQALRETLFTSSLRISPRRVKQTAQETAASFFQFLQKQDEKATGAYGQGLAQAGLGHRAVLALTEALRRMCWESANPDKLLPVSGRYAGALLQGYMGEREALILREQERTVQAFQRARDQNTWG